MSEWKYNSSHTFNLSTVEVSGQLHTLAALPPGKESMVCYG